MWGKYSLQMCGTSNTAKLRLWIFLASVVFQCWAAFSWRVSENLGLMMRDEDGLMTNTDLDQSILRWRSDLRLVWSWYGQPRSLIELCHSWREMRIKHYICLRNIWGTFNLWVTVGFREVNSAVCTIIFLLNCFWEGGFSCEVQCLEPTMQNYA